MSSTGRKSQVKAPRYRSPTSHPRLTSQPRAGASPVVLLRRRRRRRRRPRRPSLSWLAPLPHQRHRGAWPQHRPTTAVYRLLSSVRAVRSGMSPRRVLPSFQCPCPLRCPNLRIGNSGVKRVKLETQHGAKMKRTISLVGDPRPESTIATGGGVSSSLRLEDHHGVPTAEALRHPSLAPPRRGIAESHFSTP
jgi:hypothetical protein